jgi:CheY-like chemotaxis protein
MTNILVVDDAVDSAEVLAMLFEACGHETHLAFDGRQGVEEAKKHVPHIIFLDLDMPVMDGFGAAKAIREAPEADHPFIVALTAKAGADVQRLTDAAGFDFYLKKPADTNALLALVDDLEGRERGDPGQPEDV